jgi:excisionase family DNA binding protein
MQLTITEAARRYGVARSTLYRAIHQGRISATVAGDGTQRLDLAELIRLWGEPPGGTPTQRDTQAEAEVVVVLRELQDEIQALRHQVEALRALPAPAEPSVGQALRRVLASALTRLANRLSPGRD